MPDHAAQEQPPGPALLEADLLGKQFGTFTAVDDVSFSVAAGEVVGMLGANGAGKTTTIRMLLGLLEPSSGGVRVLGGRPDRTARRRLGYVPQNMGLYPDLTVQENLEFSAGAYGVAPRQLSGSLAQTAGDLVGDLSLGVQRRIAFEVALQHQPEALVLDEPTSGVEPLARARLWDTVRAQASEGVAVLVTTHDMSEAQQCDRLLLMYGGRLIASGSEADLVGDTIAIEVSTAAWADAFAALHNAQMPVTLAGRGVRVADSDPEQVHALLQAAGVDAEVRMTEATIEERMAALARADSG